MNIILQILILSTLIHPSTQSPSHSVTQPLSHSATQSPISEWQDLKFGFMMHWGIYAQWGVVESWSICNESWITREVLDDEGRPMRGTTGEDYYKYKQAYQGLNKSFAPRHFDPAAWAAAAKGAGMKYVVFTTKHHDGFCLFDTKYTDYSSTGPECPAQRDFTRGVVEAFRAAGLWTGLYFSKADWHSDDYWAHEWATPDRNVNYSIAEHPERWQRFCDFTYGQLYELTHNYGKIDILWLDGGWIRPAWSVNEETRGWLGCSGQVQDIDMGRIAKMVREANPGMIIVDRSVGGEYEEYRTPEKEVPDTLLFSRTRMFLISTLPALYNSYCTLTVLSRRTTSGSMVRLTVRSTWVPV